jgi:uncharacterized cupin superfamily protein
VVPEARLEQTDAGLAAATDGGFVVNARENRWYHADGRAALCDLEGDTPFPQLGINISVLQPGESLGLYHWEADQEDFLVLWGEALLLVEEQERPLRQWDFVHCPPRTTHIVVGAGSGPSVILAVGARVDSVDNVDWGGYPVSEVAAKHGLSVERETNKPDEAYASWNRRQPTRYRDGWLP